MDESTSTLSSLKGKSNSASLRTAASSQVALPLTDFDLEDLQEKQGDDWKPQKNELIIMISLATISLMVSLDATILVTVLPDIARVLNGTSVDAFWAGTSYLLTSAIFQPVIASISEVFGRQQLLLFSITFFTIGSILCAVANDFQVLLAGRSIQGIGGGGIITLSQVIYCDFVPLRQRPKYFAMVLGAWSIVGTIIGPVIGGTLVEKANWRWVFYINFPFCFLGFILALIFIKLNAVSHLTFSEMLQRTDWVGAILFISGMTSFLIGLSWGGVQYAWDSAQTLVPIIVGLGGVAVFALWQWYKPSNTLLPKSLFYCSSAVAAFSCAFANGLVLLAALYYVPFFAMAVRGSSSVKAGIDVFPALFLLIPGSILVSILSTRLGRFRWAIWGGWAITILGTGLMIMFNEDTKTPVWSTVLAVLGIGCGMILTSVNVGIQAISKIEDCAMAASMYGFMRSVGMPIGVSLSGAIFQNAMSSKLTALGLPSSIAHDSERYVFVLRKMAPTNPTRIAALQAYVYGFRGVWILMTAVSGSAFMISLLIKKFDMDKILLSKFSARQ
ncbi:MFS general substrate transporter [Lojkania enalia]|uniref:MFS general substrate transporter n=1 Tax=Lojkania enalia TaxID=147567 RepID=A0A9P4KAA5_9PLEO|nr:MFS general substrate transporter [Didymosphaeria enalia]